MLFAVGRTGEHQVGRLRARIAMMSDVDFERAGKAGRSDLVGTEQQDQFGLRGFEVGDPALLGIAEQQPRHPRRCGMNDVEPVPALS